MMAKGRGRAGVWKKGVAVLLLLGALLVQCTAASDADMSPNVTGGNELWGPYLTAMDTESVQVRWHGEGVSGVEYREPGDNVWKEASAISAGEGFRYAPITGLAPDTTYEYRLADGLGGGPYTFTTFPAAGSVTFAVVGDTQDDPTVPVPDGRTPLVAASIADDEDCMFLLHLGDTVGDPHDEAEWGRFFAEMGPVIAHIPIYPVMGNHERNLTVWYSAFGYPQWYAFSCGDLPVIVLDSNDWAAPRAEEQDAWLQETLAETEGSAIVAFHHPPYADDAKHAGGWRQFAERWEPLFEEYDAPVVLSGHVHAYERYERDGRVWIVAGTGGGPVYPLTDEKGEGCVVAIERTLGYLRIRSDGAGGWAGVYTAAGEITDDGTVGWFDEPQVMDTFSTPSDAGTIPTVADPLCPALAAMACGAAVFLHGVRKQKPR